VPDILHVTTLSSVVQVNVPRVGRNSMARLRKPILHPTLLCHAEQVQTGFEGAHHASRSFIEHPICTHYN
jgi:hypothetical protein